MIFYTRENCELCDQTHAYLSDLQHKFPHEIRFVDIDTDPALLEKYQYIIPVLEIGLNTLEAPISKKDLEVTLRSARQKYDSEAADPD